MSGPASAMAKSLGVVDKGLTQVERSAKSLESAGGGSMNAFADRIAIVTVGLQALVEVVAESVKKVAELGVGFFKAGLEATGLEEQSQLAFGVLLRSAEKGNAVLEETRRFALQAATPLEAVQQAYKNLLLGGVRQENLHLLVEAASDISKIQGTGTGGLISIADSFANITSKGVLAGRNLLAFQGIIDEKVLAKGLGRAGENFIQLQKSLQTSPVSADKAIPALLDAIAARLGGPLGQYSKEFAVTTGGALDRIAIGWRELLGNLDKAPEFSAFRTGLENLTKYFDPDSPQGKKLAAGMTRIFDSMLKVLDQVLSDPGSLERFFNSAIDAANNLSKAIGPIASLLGGIVDAFNGAGMLIDKIHGRGQKLEELSPELNGPTGDDLPNIPVHGSGGYFDKPHLAIVGDKPEYIIPASQVSKGGGGAGVITMNLTQHITVNGAVGDGDETGHRIAMVSQGDLQSAFEQMAQAMGAAA